MRRPPSGPSFYVRGTAHAHDGRIRNYWPIAVWSILATSSEGRLSALPPFPEAASSVLLQARIGYARAYAMFALGEPIDGRTAASIGLANAALPANEVGVKALAAAKLLASKPMGALQATKQLMRDGQAIAAVMARESEIFAARLKSPETAEALRAFVERRPPDFSKFNG